MELSRFQLKGVTYQQITKTEAKKRFADGQEICFMPNKINPFGMFSCMMVMPKREDFEKSESECVYYNCSSELGNYLHFYIEVENDEIKEIVFSNIHFKGTCKEFNDRIQRTPFATDYAEKRMINPETVFMLNDIIIIRKNKSEFTFIDRYNNTSDYFKF